jgi:transcription elongation GreA/GreB family factor
MSDTEDTKYQANDAGAIVSEIFSGGITTADAIERLRTRLLDLSSRNRLLNYRHPKGRSVQLADEPSLNLVFDRLYTDGKTIPFKYVPEPDPATYEGKRPEARLHAERLRISTSFEFPPNPAGSDGHRLHGLQTLLYPADLERQLRKIATEAKTAIEETGTNMLFLVFGFLEFYDSDDSEKPMLAPLLSVPVTLVRGEIDRDTGTYQYTVQHSGEDLAENHTLREKLRRDFTLTIPEFGDEDKPEFLFSSFEQAVRNKRRWKVRRQLTLGMLSFGKLAIWADLDTKKNPGLVDHPLIRAVFSGGSERPGGGNGALYAEDYHIDQQPEAGQSLIYDADSSQHSAIIDVLVGKNLVINGPPGTGKSQTITNVIAAALSKGKKVLFVSEKLAALEVVRRRLNHAGLGQFCLELHSHKTQKKKLLEDIRTRIEQRFPAPAQFQAKLITLQRQKMELARYAELMGSRVGNGLGLTVNEVFWAAERRRQELGELAVEVNAIGFLDASRWTQDDIESRRSSLSNLGAVHDTIGRYGTGSLWWGFWPDPLAPSDDETIGRTILRALEHAREASAAADEAVVFFGFSEQPSVGAVTKVRQALDSLPLVPEGVDSSLLTRMFTSKSDPKGQHSSSLLSSVVAGVTKARRLFESASRTLVDGERLPAHEMECVRTVVEERKLTPALLSAQIGEGLKAVGALERALGSFNSAARGSAAPYGPATKPARDAFLANCGNAAAVGLASFPIWAIASRATAVLETANHLSGALARVGAIAARNGLQFDSTPDSVERLADPDGLPGLSKGARFDAATLADARRLAALPLADRPLSEIMRLKSLIEGQLAACSDALFRCRLAAEQLGVTFDCTERGVGEVAALAKVAEAAPQDLLEYRRSTFGHPRVGELIEKTHVALAAEREAKSFLEPLFYLDALPAISEMKSAVTALRHKGGFFAFFDGKWRIAKKVHTGLSKEKRKLSSRQRADELARLISWIDAREAFVSDSELKECFGGLFRGLETDPEKISRLQDWYLTGRAELVERPGLTDKVDLTTLPAERISELAVKAGMVSADVKRLAGAEEAIRTAAGADLVGFREAKARGWDAALEFLGRLVENLGMVTGFFSGRADQALSPKDALRLMEGRVDLDGAADDLSLLIRGDRALRETGGDELGRLADLAGGRWAEAIPAVSAYAATAAETAAQALAFAGKDSLLSVAEAFARAKSALDEAWSAVVAIPAWDRFNEWPALADAARQDATAARTTLERLLPCARAGVSAAEVFAAFAEEAEARSILDRFAGSGDVRRLLGDAFRGAETDLNRLSQTHEWGDAVCALEVPAPVRRRLLSEDAQEALNCARRLCAAVDDKSRQARESVESLVSFGSFLWDEWQKQMRGGPGRDLPSEIKTRLEIVAGAPGSVLAWSKYLSLRRQVGQEGLSGFVSALESVRIPSALLGSAFELAAYQSIGRSIYQAYPELSRFDGSAHEKIRSDYRRLDAEIVALTGSDFANQIDRLKHVPDGHRGTTVGDYTEMRLLSREINKQRRHIPIRQLLKRAGKALQGLKPCFMMGPLSVAQYLEQGALKFDLVVMDEASQLRPEEALGAVARGAQLVVVGDPKQLPPTSFFDRMLDSGDEEDEDAAPAATSGMESILDICQQLFTPVRSLRWHYRSHHESLIAFSNHHFYKNLIVFPSPYAKHPGLGVKFRYVQNGSYKDRQNVPEAQRVVDAVLEHMIKRPDESLGVVTLNQTQRELIEELLDKKLKTFGEGAEFMGHWEAEGWPFFVKNLENVQGDERDVIFISTTFGKASGTDKVRQNFGPISRPDGWRRLNVLFTRSRRRIELFTSMAPEDIVVDEKTPLGTKALRDYLDFAKRGVLVTTDEGSRDPDSDFEVAVANVVTALGYEVKPQLGVAGFFIDMAVRNPDRPGEFLAGIECDGATYHSGFSVRDRDRIRQEILESLGWKGRIYRIWSTDWFYNPRRETERLQNFLEERRRLTKAEEPTDWGEEKDVDIGTQGPEEPVQTIEELVEAVTASSDSEDVFVEVGDRVTYCRVDNPEERHSALIVDSESNPRMGIINDQTPVAQALLGLSPGDIGVLHVHGEQPRQLRVLKIQRREELLA